MTEDSLLVRDVTLVDRTARACTGLVRVGTVRAHRLDRTERRMAGHDGVRRHRRWWAFRGPGLVDAHIHLRAAPHVGPTDTEPTPRLAPAGGAELDVDGLARRAQTFLYCGVTSVYDAGNNSALVMAVREAERSGEVVAPRIHCTGNLFTAPGGHGSTAAVEVREDDDVARLVAEHAALDPDLVKITYDEHGWGVRPLVPISVAGCSSG